MNDKFIYENTAPWTYNFQPIPVFIRATYNAYSPLSTSYSRHLTEVIEQ